MSIFYVLGQQAENFSVKGQIINIFSFVGQTRLCRCSPKAAWTIWKGGRKMYMSSNKSLFTKPGGGPDMACGLQFADPSIGGVLRVIHKQSYLIFTITLGDGHC